jgi:hypothetical protein
VIFLRIAVFGVAAFLAAGAQAQIAFRAATSAGVPAASTIAYAGQGNAASRNGCGTISPSLPGGTTAGDLLITVVSSADDSTIAMAGWNTLHNSIGAANEAAAIFWRIATGGDPRTITQSGNCNAIIARISRFTGVDPILPIDVGPAASFQVANTVSSGAISVPDSGAMVVFTAHANDNSNTGALAGFTFAYNSQTTSGIDAAISLYYDLPTSVPPYTAGPYMVTKTRGSDANQGVVFALRPAGSRLTLNVPAGTAVNDVLIASIAVTPSGTTVTPPAGWTSTLDTPNGSATTNRLVSFYRVATGAEPASYTFDLDGTAVSLGAAGEMIAFSGVDTVTPIDAQGGNTTASSLTHAAAAITTTLPNDMLVGAFEFAAAPAAANFNPSGGQGMTKALAQPSVSPASNAGVALVMSYGLQAAAGSSGAKSAVASGVSADRGAAQLLALRPANPLTHYAIAVLSSTVANCDYAEITITGHDATHTAVVPPSGRSLTLTTSTASGVWQAGPVAGTGAWTPSGADNGAATYLWPGGVESSFTVRLRQSAVTSLSINLNDGSVVEDPLEDPTLSFVNSAFRISSGAGTPVSIGTQIAGKPSNSGFGAQSLYLQAVRTDTSTGACVSLFPNNTDVAIEVGAQCNNPAACTQNVALSSSALSGNTALFVPDGAYPATMNFRFTTANAEAPFAFNYADAGQITLQFRAPLPSPPAGQYVQGASNAFVVRPFGLAFSGMGHANSATGPLFAAAGDNFSMTLAAYQWASGEDADNDGVPDSNVNITDNGTTPNYAATATVAASANPAGVTGAISRGAACTNAASIALAGGTATAADWCYSEVGNVLLTATAPNYLASGQDVTGTSGLDGDTINGPYVGRFRPKHFAVSNVALSTRSDLSCAPSSPFTYLDETLSVGLRLTAQNAQNATTQNYTGAAYAKLGVATFANWNFGARSGATNLTSRIDAGVAPAGSWSNGVADMTFTTAILRATPDNPDGPYQALQLGIAPVDSDTTAMDTLDLDVDAAGGNDHKDLGFTGDVRFGRLRLTNAFGNEVQRLPVPMRAEYWNGTGFVTNTDDSCTSIPRSAIALAFDASPPSALSACETALDVDPVTFSQGIAPLRLLAPATATQRNNGAVVLTVNLTGAAGNYCDAIGAANPATVAMPRPLPYLRGRWNDGADPDGNANTAYDDNPSARAGFGVYGSQPGNFIYFRERY